MDRKHRGREVLVQGDDSPSSCCPRKAQCSCVVAPWRRSRSIEARRLLGPANSVTREAAQKTQSAEITHMSRERP
jgi:hypothetical protein